MLGNLGFGEMMIIMLVILLLFGAKRLPELARALGKSMNEFKQGMNGTLSEIQKPVENEKPKIQQHTRQTVKPAKQPDKKINNMRPKTT